MIINCLLLSNAFSIAPDLILGFLFTLLFFLTSFFLVVGIKFFLIYLFKPSPAEEHQKERKVIVKRKKSSKPKIKYVEIDPDEIDQIVVKKTS